MSEIITLKDGRREWITRASDFSEILERELGIEAREYFDACMEENDDAEEEIRGACAYEFTQKLSLINTRLRKYIRGKTLEVAPITDLIEEIRKMIVDL